MAQISNPTLVLAIQAIAAEIRTLQQIIAEGDAPAEEYQSLEDHQRAAEDLERAYDEAAKTVLNLPPYDELVGR